MAWNYVLTVDSFETRHGDLYYTGPLEPAQAFVKRDQGTSETQLENGLWEVLVGYSADPVTWDNAAEWGRGETLEEAWRFALGAVFGPIDEEFVPFELAQE